MKNSTLYILGFLLITGCAANRQAQFSEFLASAVNKMTYDQALMCAGIPTNIIEGDNVIIAEWSESNRGSYSYYLFGKQYTAMTSNGYILRLTFDKKTKLLVYGQYQKW